MNLAEPIFQSYIYTDVYNSLGGGNFAVAGMPVAKLLETVDGEQTGGTRKTRIPNELSVPAGLVLIDPTAEQSKIPPSHCEVVPDDLFEKMIRLASVSDKPRTKSLRPKRNAKISKRGSTK